MEWEAWGVAIAAAVALGTLAASFLWRRPRLVVEEAHWGGSGLEVTVLNPTDVEVSVQKVALVLRDVHGGRKHAYAASRDRPTNLIFTRARWFDEVRIPPRSRATFDVPELRPKNLSQDPPFYPPRTWPGIVEVTPVGGWRARGALQPDEPREWTP